MVIQRRSLICFLLFGLSAVSLLCAANSDELPPPQFRLLMMSNGNAFKYDTGDAIETIFASSGQFTPLYQAPENRKLEFFHEAPASEDMEAPRVKVRLAEALLPDGAGPFLVLLKAAPAGSSLKYQTVIIDSSLESHPPQTYRTFNLSKRLLAVHLAGHKMLLKSGDSEISDYTKDKKAWIQVAIDHKDNGWVVVQSKSRSFDRDSRTTVFLLDIPASPRDPNPEGIKVFQVEEKIFEDDDGFHLQ